MNRVRHTSANERERGFIFLEIVTAIGTDIDIENIRQRTKIRESVF